MANNALLLLATGSIASVKYPALVSALCESFPDCWLTKAALTWCEVEQMSVSPRIVEDGEAGFLNALEKASHVVITPTSASALARLAHGLGRAAQLAMQKPLVVAPAMNVHMWNHPATQRNVAILLERGMKFLGPVAGGLACGDEGLGRFMEPATQAPAIEHWLQGQPHEAFGFIEKALVKNARLPQYAPEKTGRITLWVGEEAAADDVALLARALQEKGWQVVVAAHPNFTPLPQVSVITRHYQQDPQGFEHIRLSQQSDALVMMGVSNAEKAALQQGRGDSFLYCVWLASRVPVLLLGEGLEQDGVRSVTAEQLLMEFAAP